MGIYPSRGTLRVPQLRSPLLPSHHQRPVFPERLFWCASIALGPYPSSYLCASQSSNSLILDLITLPPSPTSPSPTQASSAAPMLSIAKLIMHRHVHIAVFRFPCVNVVHITSCLPIALLSESTFIIASAVPTPIRIRRQYRSVTLRPSFFLFLQTPPVIYYYLSTTDHRTKLLAEHAKQAHNASDSQRNSNPNPNHTYQHHCERCYDYDPSRCR